MPKFRTAMLAGAALFLSAAAAAAGAAPLGWNTATVALPDGSVAEIEYAGDIAPRVRIAVPMVQDTGAAAGEDAVLPARRLVQPRPASPPVDPESRPPELVIRDLPVGSTYEYTLITTRADGKECNQRTEWTSRGRGKDPSVRRVDTGEGCTSAAPRLTPPPASPAPVAPAPAKPPVRIDPDTV